MGINKSKLLFAKFSGFIEGASKDFSKGKAVLIIKPLSGATSVYSHTGNPRYINPTKIDWKCETDHSKKLTLDDNIFLTERFNFFVIAPTFDGLTDQHPWFFPNLLKSV